MPLQNVIILRKFKKKRYTRKSLIFKHKKIYVRKSGFLHKNDLMDRAERYEFKSRFVLFILLFFFPIFLGGKGKEEKNNQSRDFKPCLSARSTLCDLSNHTNLFFI